MPSRAIKEVHKENDMAKKNPPSNPERVSDDLLEKIVLTPAKLAPKMATGADFIRRSLASYDTRKLDEIVIRWHKPDLPQAGAGGVAGACNFPPPRQRRIGYRITCTVTGQPSYADHVAKPPLYRQPDGTWKAAQAGAAYASNWPHEVLEGLSAIELAGDADAAAMQWRRDFAKANGDMIGDYCRTSEDKQWFKVEGATELRSIDEAIVWRVSLAAFWWLRKTRQIPGRATQHAACNFAAMRLAAFRREQSRQRQQQAEAENADRLREAGTAMFPGGGEKKSPFPGGRW
jgi:hypothetical protein